MFKNIKFDIVAGDFKLLMGEYLDTRDVLSSLYDKSNAVIKKDINHSGPLPQSVEDLSPEQIVAAVFMVCTAGRSGDLDLSDARDIVELLLDEMVPCPDIEDVDEDDLPDDETALEYYDNMNKLPQAMSIKQESKCAAMFDDDEWKAMTTALVPVFNNGHSLDKHPFVVTVKRKLKPYVIEREE